MNIIDKDYLAEFRRRTQCEFCRRSCEGTDPHHILYRSHGRLDHRLNVIGLCRGWRITVRNDGGGRIVKGMEWKSCHDDAHRGDIPPADLWAMIARARQGWAREATGNKKLVLTGADCEAVCRMVAKLVKPQPHEVEAALAELTPTQRELALAIEEVKEACNAGSSV